VPPSYHLPRDTAALRDLLRAAREEAAASSASPALLGPEAWIRKSAGHRGVEAFDPVKWLEWAEHSEANKKASRAERREAAAGPPSDPRSSKPTVVQRRIFSPRLEGHVFDFSMYVLITSVLPVRLYLFDAASLRLTPRGDCAGLPDELSDPACFVIADTYLEGWSHEALRPLYADGDYNSLNVVRHLLHRAGHNVSQLIPHIKRAVVDTFVPLLVHEVEPYLRSKGFSEAAMRGKFFGLYRADMVLDQSLKPWIIEVSEAAREVGAAANSRQGALRGRRGLPCMYLLRGYLALSR
jgi:hypothetical protein